MPRTVWVYFPFYIGRNEMDQRTLDAWVHMKGVAEDHVILGMNKDRKGLSGVRGDSTVVIQGHGNEKSQDISDQHGNIKLSPQELIDQLNAEGLKNSLHGLIIKIFACYSGHEFAENFYKRARKIWSDITVDGYLGITRMAEQKRAGLLIDPGDFLEDQKIRPSRKDPGRYKREGQFRAKDYRIRFNKGKVEVGKNVESYWPRYRDM